MLVNINLLQPHTVKIYNLENKNCKVEKVNARSLLNPLRFDLYAKLFFIRLMSDNFSLANKVYVDHIKVFNPDLKEPGRDDKKDIQDFLRVFVELIKHFKDNEFDESQSIIPVGNGDVILDGAHRVAALAYFNRQVTIARYEGVKPKATFDYQYFINHGLSYKTADLIAQELLRWHDHIKIACLWPRIGGNSEKDSVEGIFRDSFPVFYSRELTVNLTAIKKIVLKLYGHQDWTGSAENGYLGATDKAFKCYAPNHKIRFVFFPIDIFNFMHKQIISNH